MGMKLSEHLSNDFVFLFLKKILNFISYKDQR